MKDDPAEIRPESGSSFHVHPSHFSLMQEFVDHLARTIRDAVAAKTPLCIRGGGTKDFYGEALRGDVLDVTPYRGIVSYEPTELVITARCGTPLAEVEAALAEKGQMLPFEPPHFGAGATLG